MTPRSPHDPPRPDPHTWGMLQVQAQRSPWAARLVAWIEATCTRQRPPRTERAALPLLATRTLDAAAQVYGVTVRDLVGRKRARHLHAARLAAMRVMLDGGLSTVVVGLAMQRDHSTVIKVLARHPDVHADPRVAQVAHTANNP